MLQDAHALADDVADIDVCIVGGGAAGLTLAARLASGGRRVLLVEAGGPKQTDESQAFYAGEVVDPDVHWPIDYYRVRALGGTSTIWGGRAIPYDPIDFERRAWVPHSGWPIGYEEVARYFPAAQEAAEAGRFDLTPSGPIVPGLESEWLHTTIERFSRPTNFWTRYGDELIRAANVRIVTAAPVTGIRLGERGDHVDHIELTLADGGRKRLRARDYVLCAGGLETARLLLTSDDVQQGGIGNAGGWLGRGYMCHLAATFGEIGFTGPPKSIGFDYERDSDGIYIRRRLALTEHAQRERELLNFTCRLHIFDAHDPAHGDAILSLIFLAAFAVKYEYSRANREADRSPGLYLRHVGNIARDPLRLFNFARTWGVKRYLSKRRIPSIALSSRSNRYPLEFHCEQAPNRESRVSLSDERDAHGLRRLRVDWRVTDLDFRTVRESYRLIGRELERTGTGSLSFDDEGLERAVMRAGAYGGHHSGTARMAASPSEGVVDGDCRVHGVDNLFVSSAAVLPTSSQANPTLTVLALGLRLADHLEDRARKPASLSAIAAAERAAVESVLVTGAAGFVGRAVARHLAREGVSVRGGVRASLAALAAEPFAGVACDVLDRGAVAAAVAGVATVIHCAVGHGNDTDVTVTGTRNLLDAAREAGVRHFVFISSVAVYGDPTGEIDENAAVDCPHGAYGRAKLEAEALCRAAAGPDFAVTVLRPTLIYGPNSAQWTTLYVDRLRAGRWRALGLNGEGDCNLVYIDDLATFVGFLVARPPVGHAVFNVNGPEVPSWNTYLETLGRALRLPLRGARAALPGRLVPRRAARLVLAVAARQVLPRLKLTRLAARAQAMHRDLPSADEMKRFRTPVRFSTARMAEAGYRPKTSLAEGVAAIAAWEDQGRPE